jgi:hypothetical protein
MLLQESPKLETRFKRVQQTLLSTVFQPDSTALIPEVDAEPILV